MSADGYANTYSPTDDRPTTFIPVDTEGMVYDLLDMNAPLESTISVTLLDALTDEPIQGASVLLYNDTRTVGRGEPVNGTATIRGLHVQANTKHTSMQMMNALMDTFSMNWENPCGLKLVQNLM